MKGLKIALAGVTVTAVSLYMMGIDSIYDNGYFFEATTIVAVLMIACKLFVSTEDILGTTKQRG